MTALSALPSISDDGNADAGLREGANRRFTGKKTSDCRLQE